MTKSGILDFLKYNLRPAWGPSAIVLSGIVVVGATIWYGSRVAADREETDYRRFMQVADTNHDGNISREERIKVYETLGITPRTRHDPVWHELTLNQRYQYLKKTSDDAFEKTYGGAKQ
jgi:hypothetical protein